MAEGYPSKSGALNQGLLQGMQAAMAMDTNIRAGKQQDLENKRWDIAQKTAADKQMMEWTLEGMKKVADIKGLDRQANFMIAWGTKINNPNMVEAGKQILANGGGQVKDLVEALMNDDILKAIEFKDRVGMDESTFKALADKVKEQKTIVSAQKATRAALGIPEGTETTLQSPPLTPSELPQRGLLSDKFNLNANTNLNPVTLPPISFLTQPDLPPEKERYNKVIKSGNLEAMKFLQEGALKNKESVKEFNVGDKTEYWAVDSNGMPIRKVEGFGGERYKPYTNEEQNKNLENDIFRYTQVARNNALKIVFANRPDAISTMMIALNKSPEQGNATMSQLETMMTPQQRAVYDKEFNSALKNSLASDRVKAEIERRMKRNMPTIPIISEQDWKKYLPKTK